MIQHDVPFLHDLNLGRAVCPARYYRHVHSVSLRDPLFQQLEVFECARDVWWRAGPVSCAKDFATAVFDAWLLLACCCQCFMWFAWKWFGSHAFPPAGGFLSWKTFLLRCWLFPNQPSSAGAFFYPLMGFGSVATEEFPFFWDHWPTEFLPEPWLLHQGKGSNRRTPRTCSLHILDWIMAVGSFFLQMRVLLMLGPRNSDVKQDMLEDIEPIALS